MYIVTGAAGFIGSCVAATMARNGLGPILLVDDFSRPDKQANWAAIPGVETVDRDLFWEWLKQNHSPVTAMVHLGARTDTTEMDRSIFDRLNFHYSQQIWQLCVDRGIPLIYASSAATYGNGEFGFQDDHAIVPKLQPLNPYGESKNEFDKWALGESQQPPHWFGLKFFNIYGPNEYHKGRMASVIFHAFQQIQASGRLKLFRSHRPDFQDGQQMRDFLYVNDVAQVILYLLSHRPASGIYNLGTGQARSFLDLGLAVFKAMGHAAQIDFIDTPMDIRDKYQYFTEAPMSKLRGAGYPEPFWSLEAGVEDYVQNFLAKKAYFS